MDYHDILDFWFSGDVAQKWWHKDPVFDTEIKEKFEDIYHTAVRHGCDAWQQSPKAMLALIITLDQFPRNMYRDTPKAFAADGLALAHAKKAVHLGYDAELSDVEKSFFYMPYMHSEALPDQETSVTLYQQAGLTENHRYAQAHLEVIAKYGRFPHRNGILGRYNTGDEEIYLAQPGAGF